MKKSVLASLILVNVSVLLAATYEPIDINPVLQDYQVRTAPAADALLLEKGDRLAICGDSITEQKMYSLIIETYLTVCEPELDISVRQYGWGGETAEGFLGRMENDCLRFKPTVATTCYGMNDFKYVPYTEQIGNDYRKNMSAIVRRFKENGTRVILGSPGCIGKKPWWQNDPTFNTHELNLSLLKLRNLDVDIAAEEEVAFADVFLPMFRATYKAQTLYGADFNVVGDDGVHPDWAGHVIMAYAFLKAMGLDGQIGAITVDLADGTASTGEAHQVLNVARGDNGNEFEMTIKSNRYPYCDTGQPDKHTSGRAGMNLVPFNQTLNRYILTVENTNDKRYKVIWGDQEKSYPAVRLHDGVNLAADFAVNPFVEPFNAVLEAVKKKQEYETKQIKSLFHGEEGTADMEATVALTEKAHRLLAENVQKTFKPVTHKIKIIAE